MTLNMKSCALKIKMTKWRIWFLRILKITKWVRGSTLIIWQETINSRLIRMDCTFVHFFNFKELNIWKILIINLKIVFMLRINIRMNIMMSL
jgi:hypothetical protein